MNVYGLNFILCTRRAARGGNVDVIAGKRINLSNRTEKFILYCREQKGTYSV
jgi:hypothetical protein